MSEVDPFIHPIPRKILADSELKPFFEYFVRWAHDIWVRTGGGNDNISDSAADITLLQAQVNALEAEVDNLQDQVDLLPENSDVAARIALRI